MSGRKDSDYVTFADYERDMRESAASAAAIVQHQAETIRDLRRCIVALVVAAGGSIEVPMSTFARPDGRLEIEDWPANNSRIFRVRKDPS